MLAGSQIKLCLDTGHLLIGGTDPLQLAREVPGRIAHAHLKDVDAALAVRVQAGELTYTEAVRAGMYTPLGGGDVDIAGIVTALRSNGFDGWFVMEQDTILDGEPTDEGPVRDVRTSVAYMHDVCRSRAGMSLRIGVLGAARIAELAIVGPAHELGHRLVAVAARDRQRAQAFAEKHGVERVLASYDDLVNDPEVDVVYNPLANAFHAPWNLAAVAAGKPVLTEKPFARNRAEAERVAAAADAAGITVMEGFHYLFHPVTRRALELAGDGTLGELVHVEVRMAMPAPEHDDPRWSLELAGGAMMDLGCYGLHVMRRLGHPSIVRAHAGAALPGRRCVVRRRARVSRRRDRTERELDGRRRLHVHPSHRRHTRRCVGAQLRQAPRRRPADHQHAGRHHGRAAGHPAVVHLSTRGVRRPCAARRPLPLDTADAVENMAYVDAAYRAAGMSPR